MCERFVLVVAVLFSLSSSVHAADAPSPATTQPQDSKWALVWSDEFDHDGLPDPAKWKAEKGFIRNNEPQYYTEGRKENARVENGMLILEARKERLENANYKADAKAPRNREQFTTYTSATLITRDIFQFQYGRVEFRAQLPAGNATWPAVWTVGSNVPTVHWPACGEIDIMEWWANNPRRMTSTLHFQKDGKHEKAEGATVQPAAITGFHLYAMEWYPDHIDFYFDGKPYHHVDLAKMDDTGTNAFRLPHFLLIDLALDPLDKIDDAALPQQFTLDYIRVYQLNAATRPATR